MSIQAAAVDGRAFTGAEAAKPKLGFWRRMFNGLIAAREREARVRVSQYLTSMSTEQLRQIGFDDSEIRSLRTTGMLPEHFAG